jgi:hypothetical protein
MISGAGGGREERASPRSGEAAVSRYRYKPSKPVAVFGLVVGVAMIVLVLTTFRHGNSAFVAIWCVAAAGIIGLSLWAVSSRNGSLATWTSRSSRRQARRAGRRPPVTGTRAAVVADSYVTVTK